MTNPKLVRGLLFLLASSLFIGCFRPAIPISTGPNYPIDVFMSDQAPDRPYSEIQWVEISRQDSLDARQSKAGNRMAYRGNDAQAKDLLTAQLVLKAQKMGADALINVKYQYYTSATIEGYSMKGLAVKYRGD
jgi:uncharacterized protein YbjQ (UPF0145 family)